MELGDWPHLLTAVLDEVSNGVTVADATAPDRPLIFVNQAFEKITGYPASETIGRNGRFLQGKDTDRRTIARVRDAVDRGERCHVVVRNYRKDGSSFLNELKIFPIAEEGDRPSHFMGIHNDVTSQFIALALQHRLKMPPQMQRDLESFSPQTLETGVDVEALQQSLESVGAILASGRGEILHRDVVAESIMSPLGPLRSGASIFDLFEAEGLIDCFRPTSRPSSQWIPARLRLADREKAVLLRAYRAPLPSQGSEMILVLLRGSA